MSEFSFLAEGFISSVTQQSELSSKSTASLSSKQPISLSWLIVLVVYSEFIRALSLKKKIMCIYIYGFKSCAGSCKYTFETKLNSN